MTWLPLLLSDPSPNLRILVLKDLLKRPAADEEVQELIRLREKDPIVKPLFKFQKQNGSWDREAIGTNAPGGNIQTTSQALVRLGYLGFESDHPAIEKGVNFLFSKQNEDGSWPLPKAKEKDELSGYDMQPLQTVVPLEGIAACGYATDKRAEKAYEWLIDVKLNDGSWPVGITAGVYGGIAGYRKLAHSRWGCRSTTIGVLNCFSYHPKRKNSPEAQRAFDLVLGSEIKQSNNLGFVISRLIGLESSRGWITYYPKLDPAHILKLCWRIGASKDDERVVNIIDFIREEQGEYGLWECYLHPQASRWLTYDIIYSLSHIEETTNWISTEPHTPFQAYPKKIKRF